MEENSMEYNPDWISPPGDTILDLMLERRLGYLDLATCLFISSFQAYELVNGNIPITKDIAKGLARCFGSTPDFWLKRQTQYEQRIEESGYVNKG